MMIPTPQPELPADAGLTRRALARLVDGLMVLGATTSAIVAFFINTTTVDEATTLVGVGGVFDGRRVVANTILAVVATTYFVVAEAGWAKTPGKRLVGLTVIGADGNRPRLRTTIGRNSWLLLPILPWLGVLALALAAIMIGITIYASDTNTGWHDELSNTAVVAKPSTPRSGM